MPAFIRTIPRKAARNRAKAANYRKVCALVDARDRKTCRVCLRYCRDTGIHHHHVVFRSQGGKDTTDNVITVCAGGCHEAIHNQRIRVTGTATDLHIKYRPAQGWDGPNSAMSHATARVQEDTAL